MISDREFARRCSELVLEYSGKLDQSVAEAQSRMSDEEFEGHRRAVGAIMAEGLTQLLNQIFRQHPDLKPDGFE